MKKIIRIEQAPDSPMHLTWVINNICTNTCSYCPENLHSGANHHYDWENARVFFKMLFERYPRIHCTVSGGEPSLSPFLPEIVKTFHDKGHSIGLTSNAAKPARYWAELAPYLHYICFSYHVETPDPNFLEKVRAACMDTLVTVRVMMHPNHWQASVDAYNRILADNEYIFVEAVRVLPWNRDLLYLSEAYTDEQLQWFDDNYRPHRILNHIPFTKTAQDLIPTFYFDDGTVDKNPNTIDYINSGMTNFNGYTCDIGLKELFVNYLGEVSLGNCDTDNCIGHINEPDKIKWPSRPVLCDKSLCHCTTSVNINKWL